MGVILVSWGKDRSVGLVVARNTYHGIRRILGVSGQGLPTGFQKEFCK